MASGKVERTARPEYDKHIGDFRVCYYLTEGILSDSGRPYYGVLLEKTYAKNEEPPECSAVNGVSEDRGHVARILKLLHDMNVTPMSLYDVIDKAAEMNA